MKKTMTKIFGSLLVLTFVISLVSAFGVSSFYWDTNPLKLSPGESQVVYLALQNMVGEEDYTFSVVIREDGNGIASLVDENATYFVPANTQRLDVPIRISIPKDTAYGETRQVHVSFIPVTPAGDGMISITSAVGSRFPVQIVTAEESTFYKPKVVEETPTVQEKSSNFVLYLVLAIVIVVILIIAIKKKK